MTSDCRAELELAERIEAIELPLLLEALHQRYGYDFRDYAPASLLRRLRLAMQAEQLTTVSAFQDRLLHDPACMARLLDTVSVDVTAMFRDPAFYLAFRDQVVPGLQALPHLKVWVAGCASGEEVYSLAIVLFEAGLLEKTQLYATDFNARGLAQGQAAIFPIRKMREYTANYVKAGGQAAFSDYYTAKHDAVILRDGLRRNIVWAEHNLATDSSFNEFHVVLCRNVMIYFTRKLQERVLGLLYGSLAMQGVLGLGHGESLHGYPVADCFAAISRAEKLYRKLR